MRSSVLVGSPFLTERLETEGGEALALGIAPYAIVGRGVQGEATERPRWRVLWTHSHCEQLVSDQLTGLGYEVFLPTVETWSIRGGDKHLVRVPLFPGYLFLNHALDRTSRVEVLRARGLVRILDESLHRAAVVPEMEIEGIRKVVELGVAAQPHPYLREGQRVRVVRGPLKGVEGILLRYDSAKGRLVLSIELLQRSVAVDVDCTSVAHA